MLVTKQKNLLENHLAFLGSHRGNITRSSTEIMVVSDRPEFTFIIPATGITTETIKNHKTIYLYPWASEQEENLKQLGYTSKSALNYMVLETTVNNWKDLPELEIRKVKTITDMDAFSETQSRGFLESEAAYLSWHPWLRAANHRNLENGEQAFYVGYFDSKPAGVVLTVKTGDSIGIYAVATEPSQRKKGVSTAIMKKAILDAQKMGCKIITLQVVHGSYAEAFYQKLGFNSVFITKIYSR